MDTCFSIDLYPIGQELLKDSNLHDLVLDRLRAVDNEGLWFDLLYALSLSLLCCWRHHLAAGLQRRKL